jgi:hypothetical protein
VINLGEHFTANPRCGPNCQPDDHELEAQRRSSHCPPSSCGETSDS